MLSEPGPGRDANRHLLGRLKLSIRTFRQHGYQQVFKSDDPDTEKYQLGVGHVGNVRMRFERY